MTATPKRRRRLAAVAIATAIVVAIVGFTQPMREDGRFTNLDGSGPAGFKAVFKWAVVDRITGKRRKSPDHAPVATVIPDLARIATPPGPGEPARLTWLGHASWLVQVDGASLLVDPVLKDGIFGGYDRNVPPGVRIEQLPPIDAILVSHSHYDHLDLPTILEVKAPVIAGLGLRPFFRKRNVVATELGWWDAARVRDVRITFVPAQHWSRRGPFDTNRTLWGGFVIEGRAATVYHAGDTGWFEGFALIRERFPRIDAALIPIGAYDPGWFMERQHLNPEQAVEAFLALGAGAMFGMHWGTFKLTDEPLDEPPRRLEAERLRRGLAAEQVRVLAVGETVEAGRAAQRDRAARP